jgi:Transmembrane secretion effector
MNELRQIRLRDGAIRWGLWSDTGAAERQLESFVVESWVEHVRQHERMTAADRAVQARIHAFHRGAGPPRVTHYVSAVVPSAR